MTRPLVGAAMLLCLCAAANAQSTLQVLDYGAEPRSTIRYQFKPGQIDRATMEMAMSMSMEMNGEKVPSVVMPPVRMTMELRVTEVMADGSARLEFRTTSAEAPVEQVAGQANQALLNRTLAGITLLSGSYRTDTRGRVLESNVSLPESVMPANAVQTMNELMGQGNESLQQFPEEVVGAGARWQVVQRRETGGMTIILAQEFTLKSRSGDRIELLVKSAAPVITPGSGPVPAAASAAGPGATGTMSIDLRKLVPTMSIEGGSSSTTTLPTQGEPRVMKTSSRMRMSIVPVAE